jgi:hypothetical protein
LKFLLKSISETKDSYLELVCGYSGYPKFDCITFDRFFPVLSLCNGMLDPLFDRGALKLAEGILFESG